jgi:hypothetical protein
VLFCPVQFRAERFSSPVGYCPPGFIQFATDEVCDYAEAAEMPCVVVHEQFICLLGDLDTIFADSRWESITRDTEMACPPRLIRTNTRPKFTFASSVEIKRTFVE